MTQYSEQTVELSRMLKRANLSKVAEGGFLDNLKNTLGTREGLAGAATGLVSLPVLYWLAKRLKLGNGGAAAASALGSLALGYGAYKGLGMKDANGQTLLDRLGIGGNSAAAGATEGGESAEAAAGAPDPVADRVKQLMAENPGMDEETAGKLALQQLNGGEEAAAKGGHPLVVRTATTAGGVAGGYAGWKYGTPENLAARRKGVANNKAFQATKNGLGAAGRWAGDKASAAGRWIANSKGGQAAAKGGQWVAGTKPAQVVANLARKGYDATGRGMSALAQKPFMQKALHNRGTTWVSNNAGRLGSTVAGTGVGMGVGYATGKAIEAASNALYGDE